MKNNRILNILCISFVILFTLCTSCFASDINLKFSFKNSSYEFVLPGELSGEGYNYFIVADKNGVPLNCLYYRQDNADSFTVEKTEDGKYHFLKCNDDCLFILDYNNGEFVWHDFSRDGFTMDADSYVIYSTRDIKYSNGDTFFYVAPLATLPQVVQVVELGEVLQEIVKIIPTILVVVVSLVGLRKALRMLLTVLHRS